MRRDFARHVLTAVALIVLSGTAARVGGQGLTGQISGTISDSNGGVIPGVTVTITNAGTAATRQTVTGPDGSFLFPDLFAGTYALKAELAGFMTYEQTGIVLSATDRVALRGITLELGGIQETVTVSSEAPLQLFL